MIGPWPGLQEIYVAMGCFWGAERLMWQLDGVHVTAVGYQGGHTPNPTYNEVCGGKTAHTEVVRVVYDPAVISTEAVLRAFWEGHNPTQGMRQGNDSGTQYRSAVYWTTDEQAAVANATHEAYQAKLAAAGHGDITTELADAGPFYLAEDYHQQYLAKNPNGYCGIGGTGVSCPIGLGN
jgi:peptide-methionine (S)-S-oxide reductase